MRTFKISVLLCLALLASGCATSHAVRWAYGAPTIYHESSNETINGVLKPALGPPMILSGLVWDVITLPGQAIFGVWPFWGSASRHFKPEPRGTVTGI